MITEDQSMPLPETLSESNTETLSATDTDDHDELTTVSESNGIEIGITEDRDSQLLQEVEDPNSLQLEVQGSNEISAEVSEQSSDLPIPELHSPEPRSPEPSSVDLTNQVRLYRRDDRLVLVLPAESVPVEDGASAFTWTDLWHQLKHRLNSGEQFWQAGMLVELVACDRLLDQAQLQEIADTLAEAQLNLRSVATNRRQTAIVAATAGYSVDQHPNQSVAIVEQGDIQAEPLYLQTTLRSGVEICHPGSVIVYGDTNPGSSIIANGDILVWGRLRGVAHAGAKGNHQACIMALQIEPPAQLRVADYRARAPKPLDQAYPEVAYVSEGAIRIAHANEFSRPDL
jgi:septum site-determining protein MinC